MPPDEIDLSAGLEPTPKPRRARYPSPEPSRLDDLISFAKENNLTVGSTTGGRHNVGSRHYSGNAIDLKGSGGYDDATVKRLSEAAAARGFLLRDERRRPPRQKVWGGPHLHIEVPRVRLTSQQQKSRGIDLSAGLEQSEAAPPIDLSTGVSDEVKSSPSSSPAPPPAPLPHNRYAAMARIAQHPVRGVRGRIPAAPRQLEVGGRVGGGPSTGAADLRRIDEPETQRINRIQREVTAAQTPAERQLQRAPGTQSARLLDPKLTEHEEVLRRLVAEQDEEKRSEASRAESQRLMAQFTDVERAEIADFVNHLQGKGSIYTGARTGLRRAGSSALYKLAGLAEAANPLLAKSTGIPDYLRKKALAGEISLEDIPTERRNQIAEFLAETGVGLAELAAIPGGMVTKFATLSGSEALGRNRPTKEVIGETAKGAAMGVVQKYGEALAPPTASYGRRLVRSAPAIGAGSAAVELATGATPREAALSAVTNAAFQGLGEIGRGRRGLPGEQQRMDVRSTPNDSTGITQQLDANRLSSTVPPEAASGQDGTTRTGQEGGPARSAVAVFEPETTVRPETATESTQPRRWLHADFGEVTEAPSQARAGKGRVRVIAEDGSTHYVKKADLSGRGNQRMIPVKSQSEVRETPELATEQPEAGIPPMRIPRDDKARLPVLKQVIYSNLKSGNVYVEINKQLRKVDQENPASASRGTIRLADGSHIDSALVDKVLEGDRVVYDRTIDTDGVRERSQARIKQDSPSQMEEYAKRFTDQDGVLVLNVDNARELSPDYAQSLTNRSRFSDAVHEASSQLVKDLYARELAKPVNPEKNIVVFTGGGAGVGKTSAVEGLMPENSALVYDTNLSNFESATTKIDQAVNSGREVDILAVYRDPIAALVEGVLPRTERDGRTVPLPSYINTHVGFAETLPKLMERYKDDPRVKIRLIDNSGPRGTAREGSLDLLRPQNYNELLQRALDATEAEYKAGRISKRTYEGTLRGTVRPPIEAGNRESQPERPEKPTSTPQVESVDTAGINLESGLERRSPERVPQTDWLAMSDAERAQIRKEIDLEQANPVEPKPAQVDILTPREGERLQEPIRQPATETVTETKPPESTTSARKSQLAQDRADLDLPELPAAERKSWQQSLSEARPERAGLLADEVLSRPRALNDSETASLVVRAQEIKNDHARALEEIGAAKDPDVIEQKRAELTALEREFDKLTEATKRSGTEKGRSLAAQKLTINQDFDLISMKNRVKADKGAPLTEKENAQIEELHAKLAKAEAERDAANERAAQAQLQKEIDKVAKRGTRRQQRTETKQSLDTEFADLKAQFAKARAEISGTQPSGLAGFDPEGKLTKIIAQMARNRVKAGVTDAAQLVDDVFAAVSDSVEGLTKRDVRDAISGYGLQRGDQRSPEAKQLAAIRAELQSLSKTEDTASGQRSPRQEGPQRDFRKDQQRQRQLEKQEADIIRRMVEGDFDKSERVPPTYTRETYAKQRVVDQLKADFEKMRYRATRSTGGKIIDTAIGMANVPKTFLSMGDLSALLRQGGVGFMQHPVLSARAVKSMYDSFSRHGFANVQNAIKSAPDFELARRSGVEFTGIDKDDPRLSRREEGYLGSGAIDTLAKGRFNLPGKAVKEVKDFSERTFVSFLDAQRMNIFEQQAQALRDMKLTGKDLDAALKSQAKYINIITGRGSLGERGNQYAPALNLAMFSPRLVASRFQLLNKMLNPFSWARLPKGARKLQLVDNAKFLVGTATVLGLAKAAGADVNLDPEDSDFLKIKIGNTRYDTLTGLQQPMRFMLRLSSAIKAEATGDETYAGGDKGDIVADFARSKASPELGLGVDWLAGGNRLSGEKFSLGKNAREAVTPLPIQDFMEAAKTDGKLRGIIETLPALLGVGAQTYKSGEKPTTHAEKLARKLMRAKMPDEFRDQDAIDVDAKKSDLRVRSRRGEDVKAEIKALGAKITDRQAKNILNARSKTRLQEDFNRLGVKDASLVYSVATPAQRTELQSLMRKKVSLVNALPLDQQPAVKERLKSLGVTP